MYDYDAKDLNYWQAELTQVQYPKIVSFVKSVGTRVINSYAMKFKLKI